MAELQNESSGSTPEKPGIPLRRRLLYLSVPYLIFAGLILGIEGGTRLFLPEIPALEMLVQPPALRPNMAERIDSSIFMGDPRLFWRLRPHLNDAYWDFTLVSTNAQGFRHNGDIGRKKADAFRVVCLGDSVTFGYRVPLCFPEHPEWTARQFECYPLIWEKKLREMNPGRQIEIIPLAVPAYTSYMGLNWLRRDIASLQPDIVTTCFGWNDIGFRSMSDRQAMPNDLLHVSTRWLMCHSQGLTHFLHWRQDRKAAANPAVETLKAAANVPRTTPRVSQTEFVANQLEMAKIARSHGAQPLFIGTIYRDPASNPGNADLIKKYRAALHDAATSNAVPYLEIPEMTEASYPANKDYFAEEIHPSGWGHILIADKLLQFCESNKMLKSLKGPSTPSEAKKP